MGKAGRAILLEGLMVEKLTHKQAVFIQEYLVDLNATQAAIRAGYSEHTARIQASRLLSNANIQQALTEAQNARAARTQVTQDRVIQEIARLGLSDMRKLFNEGGRLLQPHEWDDDTAAAVASIEVDQRKEPGDDGEEYTVTKIKAWDKNAALEKLCKHLGLYEKDNAQLNNGPPEIQVSFVGMEDAPTSEPNE